MVTPDKHSVAAKMVLFVNRQIQSPYVCMVLWCYGAMHPCLELLRFLALSSLYLGGKKPRHNRIFIHGGETTDRAGFSLGFKQPWPSIVDGQKA